MFACRAQGEPCQNNGTTAVVSQRLNGWAHRLFTKHYMKAAIYVVGCGWLSTVLTPPFEILLVEDLSLRLV